MALPQKILTRKDEITADFLKMVNAHLDDIMAGRVATMFHIKDFAERLFIHPTHLSNTIKLVTGRAPCDFVEDRIMDEARKMLRETPLAIAEVGYRLTFSDPTNFTKFFKHFEGKTPRQYRAQFIDSETITSI